MRWMKPARPGVPSLPCPTREEIQNVVGCETCGAVIEEECREGNTSRDRNHMARQNTGRRLLIEADRRERS